MITRTQLVENKWLHSLPSMAANHGLYADFIPYHMDSNGPESGFYFYASTKPFKAADVSLYNLINDPKQHRQAISTEHFLVFIHKNTILEDEGSSIFDACWEQMKRLEGINEAFKKYGPLVGIEKPEVIYTLDGQELAKLYRDCVEVRMNKHLLQEVDTRVNKKAEENIIKYFQQLKKMKNPKIWGIFPNPAYIKNQFQLNPKLLWSKNPFVRMYNWFNRNKPTVSMKTLSAYCLHDTKRIMVPDETVNMHTGEKINGENTMYSKFIKEFTRLYPNVPICVTNAPDYDRGEVEIFQPEGENTYITVKEKNKYIYFADVDTVKITGLWNYLCLTEDINFPYQNGLLKPEPCEKIIEQGDYVVRYLDIDILINVAHNFAANNIKYSIGGAPGCEYQCDDESRLPIIFSKENEVYYEIFTDKYIENISVDHSHVDAARDWAELSQPDEYEHFDYLDIGDEYFPSKNELAEIMEEFEADVEKPITELANKFKAQRKTKNRYSECLIM